MRREFVTIHDEQGEPWVTAEDIANVQHTSERLIEEAAGAMEDFVRWDLSTATTKHALFTRLAENLRTYNKANEVAIYQASEDYPEEYFEGLATAAADILSGLIKKATFNVWDKSATSYKQDRKGEWLGRDIAMLDFKSEHRSTYGENDACGWRKPLGKAAPGSSYAVMYGNGEAIAMRGIVDALQEKLEAQIYFKGRKTKVAQRIGLSVLLCTALYQPAESDIVHLVGKRAHPYIDEYFSRYMIRGSYGDTPPYGTLSLTEYGEQELRDLYEAHTKRNAPEALTDDTNSEPLETTGPQWVLA